MWNYLISNIKVEIPDFRMIYFIICYSLFPVHTGFDILKTPSLKKIYFFLPVFLHYTVQNGTSRHA